MDSDSRYLHTARFGPGDAIVEGWHFFRKHFWTNILLSIISYLPALIVSLLVFGSRESLYSLALRGTANICGLTFLGVVCFLFFISFGYGSLAYLTSKTVAGEEVTLGAALRYSRTRLMKIIGTQLLMGLKIALLWMLLIIPGVIYAIRYAFGPITAALRGTSGNDALEYSKRLVQNRWWWVFSVQAFIYVLSGAISYSSTSLLYQINYLPIFFVMLLTSIIYGYSIVMLTVYFMNCEVQEFSSTQAVILPSQWTGAKGEHGKQLNVAPLTEPTAGSGGQVELIQPEPQPGAEAAENEPLTAPEESLAPLPVLAEAVPAAPTGEPLQLQPPLRNNAAVASLALAVLCVLFTGSGLLLHLSAAQVGAAFAMAFILALYLGNNGSATASKMEGKGKKLALGAFGLSAVAAVLMGVLIFAPPGQVFEANGVRLSYPAGWQTVDTSGISGCDTYKCLLALNHQDNKSSLVIMSIPTTNSNLTIDQIDQMVWQSIQDNGSATSVSRDLITVGGQPASRRIITIDQSGTTLYFVYGMILTRTTTYQYVGTSSDKSAHLLHAPEIDAIIQSIQFTTPQTLE